MQRISTILAAEDASTAGTKTIDIDLSDIISRIIIQFKGTNNGSTPTAHPAKMVTKIELVDGSNVLYSASGYEIQALNICEGYGPGFPGNVYADNVMAILEVSLDFGRYQGDKQYAFDPTKFTNPQLKITHNKILGGSTPDAGSLSVFAVVMDRGTTAPVGFFMTKEQYNYTLVASAHEYVDLPLDYPYRKMMILSRADGKQPWEQYNKLKLTIDHDKKIIFNDEMVSNLLKYMPCNPYFNESVLGIALSGTTVFITPTYGVSFEGIGIGASGGYVYGTQSYGGTTAITAAQSGLIQMMVNGMSPHGALCLPFGMQDDDSDWFDPKKEGVGSLRLDVTAGSGCTTSSTAQILTQQVRKY